MEDYLSSECKIIDKNDFEQNFENSKLFSLQQTNMFPNFQNEFQPAEDDTLFGFSSENTALQYNPQMEGTIREPQMYNASGQETSFQRQNHFQADQPNSHYQYNSSSGKNTEKRERRVYENSVNTSFDSRRTPTTSETLFGLDSLSNDLLSPTIDSLLLDMPQLNSKLLDSQREIPILNDEILASIFSSINESSIENVELKNKLFKHDSSVESLKSLAVTLTLTH
ncbi:uncharacterized protein TNIN_41781 [Trichonephila inaurata madagascariensis]|uniref:Uncharacterized protein n=1 Tax=Trichonephila inaurata madagascariensis TaxID=2747483 RepID=A0A8X6MA80_9ARAC|nr:uncharacterized protein TNIN_41781 [Trichonephila inaurata madagascariensis]